MQLFIDLHCHSRFSADGVAEPEALVKEAKAKGLNGFAITGNNSTVAPPLSNDSDYQSICLVNPPQFQVTRGNKWHYGSPGNNTYNHIRVPNDSRSDCRGGLPGSSRLRDSFGQPGDQPRDDHPVRVVVPTTVV